MVFLLLLANVNQKTKSGLTPLDIACSLGRLKMVKDLIEHGAEINYKDPTGKTPMERAEFFGHFEITELL
jgi:ankyrin repeat protein